MPEPKNESQAEMVDLLQAYAWECPDCNRLHYSLVHVVEPIDPEFGFASLDIPEVVVCEGCGREFPVSPDEDDDENDDDTDETGVYPPVKPGPAG